MCRPRHPTTFEAAISHSIPGRQVNAMHCERSWLSDLFRCDCCFGGTNVSIYLDISPIVRHFPDPTSMTRPFLRTFCPDFENNWELCRIGGYQNVPVRTSFYVGART